jgi:hypothetical protein
MPLSVLRRVTFGKERRVLASRAAGEDNGRVTTPAAEDPELTAMVEALADGKPAGDLERAILRLKLITEARARGLSWNKLAVALRCSSGKQLRKETARLAEHVSRQLRLAQNRNG